MPSSVMDQRNFSPFGGRGSSETSSFFSEELLLPTERQVGFWKPESVPDHRGTEMPSLSGSKSVSSSPLNKIHLIGGTMQSNELSQPYLNGDLRAKTSLDRQLVGSDRMNMFSASWGTSKHVTTSGFDILNQPATSFVRGGNAELSRTHYENGIFPNNLSDVFNKKLIISSSNVALGQSVDTFNSNFEEDEPFESMEEIEAQTIGNLLPDDDELLSGVVDGDIFSPFSGEDIDDDIFCSGGGMELEADDLINGIAANELIGGGFSNSIQGGSNGTYAGEHPFGEHPSRTLFVRNINSNVEDTELKALFEHYGDIRALYTACKHRGFVMISYYDIRSARNAMRALQNKPLRRRKLDIHFSIPKDNPSEKDINQGTLVVFNLESSVSNEDLRQIFGIYGEIKEIRETPHKRHHKFIEFYDIRAADAALRALNRSDIAGKKIKLEPSRPGGLRRVVQQSSEIEQDDLNGCKQGSPNCSPSGHSGSVPLGLTTTNNLENGSIQGLQSAVRAPVGPFMENTFHGISSSVPQNSSSPIRITSVGNLNNQAVSSDLSHSLGQMNFGLQGIPNFHPHSLPEYHNGAANGMPYASSNSVSAIGLNIRPAEGIDNRHLNKVNSGGLNNSFDHNEGAFGASGNGSCPLHGHQYVWNNTNAFQHQLPGPVVWSNSLPFMNTVSAHPPPQMHGIPRAPPHMMKTVMPSQHVGSAPTVNPTLWDRRHTYSGDAADSQAFHPGSLGTIGLTGSPQFHQLELASRGIFPRAGGNCMDPSISPAHIGIPSPQQRCQIFHGRNHMIPMPGSFDGSSDRMRSRRNDANANQADNKKQYELDIERIVRGEDSRTTLMIKNIPNKYTSKMLLAAIDENHRGTYDFIYLPIDFKNKCNVGYAFINMIDPQHIIPFYQSFNGKKWEKFNSEKVASLAYARIQGKSALIAHFQNSSLMNEDKRCRPILFHSDGPNAGDQEPFPMGINIRSRSGRSRAASSNEEQHDASPPASANGESSGDTAVSPDSAKDSE